MSLQALCQLTVDYCQLVKRAQVQRTAVALMTSALWGKLLRKYGVHEIQLVYCGVVMSVFW